MSALDGRVCLMNLTTEPMSQLYSGREKDGYTVDSLETTGWLDLLEIDFQRKLRLCENHASDYNQLLQQSPQCLEPVGDISSLYDEGEVSINVTNALQDQEVPDFFATPVMKPLTLDAHKIFDDPAHYQGWVDAVKAELKSFEILGVKDDVPYQRYPNIISAQLVATVKPSDAIPTLPTSSQDVLKGTPREGVLSPPEGEASASKGTTQGSSAKDREGESQFVCEFPLFPPSAQKTGKNSAKNAKNKQAKRFTDQGMNEEVYSKGKKKVRIVCCGNQQQIQDFEDTATQTPPFSMLRLALAMASVFGWTVASADISTAFLYASLHQEDVKLGFDTVYVRPPKILVTIGLVPDGILWKLKKSLYGLRTSPLAWERERDATIATLSWKVRGQEYRLSLAAPCVWKIVRRHAKKDELPSPLGFFIAYVDDLLAVAREEHLLAIMDQLKNKYSMKMTGTLSYPKKDGELPITFLGCSLWRDEKGSLWMSQIKYIFHCLRENGWIQNQKVILKTTTTLPTVDEKREDEPDVDEDSKGMCQKYIGQLMWLATRTRPDITTCLGVLATLM
eukprot:6480737-Amphidinium_carterae.1